MCHKGMFLCILLPAIIILVVSGCSAPQNTGITQSAPTPLVYVQVSFPDGAPPLGQTARLVATVDTHVPAKDLSVGIDLPDGLELVSGELSWFGSIPEGCEIDVINAVVKSVEVGNWIIEENSYLDYKEHSGFGIDGGSSIYVAISEDSAEWGLNPPWFDDEYSPVKMEVSDIGEPESYTPSDEESSGISPSAEDLPDPPALPVDW